MMDKFEKNIRDNSALFDEHKADKAKLWATIELALDDANAKTKVIPFRKSSLFRLAASILLVLGLTGIISISFLNIEANSQDEFASKELQDIEMHYKGLVNYQIQLVKKTKNLSEEDKVDFLSFIDELDLEYKELKQEMKKNIDNERILEAIILNFKKRIELIENLLKQIKDATNAKNKNYEYTL